jgi:hypothetical protein
MQKVDRHLRDVLLEAIGLDNSQCDLSLVALIQKVATERKDLVQSWGGSDGKSGSCLYIEDNNGDVEIIYLGNDCPTWSTTIGASGGMKNDKQQSHHG